MRSACRCRECLSAMTAEQYKEQMKPRALQNIQSRLVLEAVAAAEKIEITEEDTEAEFQRMAELYRTDIDKVKNLLGEERLEDMKKDGLYIEKHLLGMKAIDLVRDAAVEE